MNLTKQSAKVFKGLAKDLQKLGVTRFQCGDVALEFAQPQQPTNGQEAIRPLAVAAPEPDPDAFDEAEDQQKPTAEELRRLAHDRVLYWSATNG